MNSGEKALVLFSGGQDSATCLAWALERFSAVETVAFDYGQRHKIELECREEFLAKIIEINPVWKKRLGPDHKLDLSVLGKISETSLTQEAERALRVNMTMRIYNNIQIDHHMHFLNNLQLPQENLLFLER